MTTLEEGFKDILKEVTELRNVGSRGTSAGEEASTRRRVPRSCKDGTGNGPAEYGAARVAAAAARLNLRVRRLCRVVLLCYLISSHFCLIALQRVSHHSVLATFVWRSRAHWTSTVVVLMPITPVFRHISTASKPPRKAPRETVETTLSPWPTDSVLPSQTKHNPS